MVEVERLLEALVEDFVEEGVADDVPQSWGDQVLVAVGRPLVEQIWLLFEFCGVFLCVFAHVLFVGVLDMFVGSLVFSSLKYLFLGEVLLE